MKKVNVIMLLIGAMLLNTAIYAGGNPVEYLNQLNAHHQEIAKKTLSYTTAVAKDKSGRKIDKKRTSLIAEITNAIKEVKKVKDYEGDGSLRDSVLNYLEMNKSLLTNEYAKIVDLEAVAEESYDMMEAYLRVQDEANAKMQLASENLNDKVREFANTYDIKIVENEDDKVSLKLKQASRMWNYYNEIYLIFFKSFKQEAYFLDALNRGDVNAMEQNNNSLASFANEGLEKLKKIKAFDGDNSLLEKCKEVLEFYKDQAENKYPKMIAFNLKKEHFENVKAAFDKMPKKKRTQAKVDEYNNAINDYNSSINEFNSINEDANKKRSKLLDKWNKTASKFTSKHVK